MLNKIILTSSGPQATARTLTGVPQEDGLAAFYRNVKADNLIKKCKTTFHESGNIYLGTIQPLEFNQSSIPRDAVPGPRTTMREP